MSETLPDIAVPELETIERPAEFRLPNLLHALMFFLLAGLVMTLVTVSVLGAVLAVTYLPGFHPATLSELTKNAIVLMIAQALSYIIVLLIAAWLFGEWWQKKFYAGIEWNWHTARKQTAWLAGAGLVLGMLAYLASTLLTVPKSLPVDDYFQKTSAVWLIAIFGCTLGPMFEEIVFRGFLQPALTTAWMWGGVQLGRAKSEGESYAAITFSVVLTSIAFTAIHAPQLANNLSVLGLLFLVSVVLTMVKVLLRSVAASTLVHAGYNLWNFVLMFILTSGFRHLEKLQR